MNNDIIKKQYVILLAVFLYRANDCLSKIMLAKFSFMDLMFYRSFTTILLFPVLVYFGGITFKNFFEPKILLRNFLAALALFLDVGSLAYISLGTFVLLSYLGPVMTKIMARQVLKEKFEHMDWLVILVSLVGTYLIVKSSLQSESIIGVVMALSGAFFYATSCIVTKTISNPDYNTLYASYIVLICVLSAFTIPTGMPQGKDYIYIFVMAFMHMAAFMLYIKAFMALKTSRATILEYMGIIFAVFFDFLFWDSLIDFQHIMGGSLIISVSILSIYRQTFVQVIKRIRALLLSYPAPPSSG